MEDHYSMLIYKQSFYLMLFMYCAFSLGGGKSKLKICFLLSGCPWRQTKGNNRNRTYILQKKNLKTLFSYLESWKEHQGVSENKEYQEQSYYKGFHYMLSFGSFCSYFCFMCLCICCIRVCICFVCLIFCLGAHQVELDL